MSRWKGLPETLDHRVRQLVVQLRRLKDHSGLSLASLAAKTAYSKSSWERYLNGKKLPPREAVVALARVCGADPTRLLALHEVAAQAWGAERAGARPVGPSERAGQSRSPGAAERDEAAPPAEDEPATPAPATPAPATPAPATPAPAPSTSAAPAPVVAPPGRSWLRRGPLALLGGLVVVAVAAVVLLAVRPWQDDGGGGRGSGTATAGRTAAATPAFSHRVGETFRCHVRRAAGVLTADRSRSTTAILGSGATGWEVVEAQCLLNHRGYDPGPVDGIVGEHTMRAVKRLQAAAGLPTDGIVGPDTWKVLRR
ncbi:peptidoglycan-binding protein [Streptomyces sp. NRRL S-337]|uniref:peptidoglycan-binding protein n=1 Tax=Streptomyces sp. NRRL S-337 TaxID=1463900 RepID=UPI0004C4A171|nr:peptidoglycan-binding protein [Streptomyces sp. NRRL S-337]